MKIASIIMPMHSDPDFEIRRRIINEVADHSGWTLLIPDYDPLMPEFDADLSSARLDNAALVIADLSRARPSCYFELGFAEALRKPFELIAEHGTEIHQTAGRDRVLYYSGHDGFREALISVLSQKR